MVKKCETVKKPRIINMNYPPDDVPMEEIERFWGTLTKEEGHAMSVRWRAIVPTKGEDPRPGGYPRKKT